MSTVLQVQQAFDNYTVGQQITIASDAAAQALVNAYPGRFQVVSGGSGSDSQSGGSGSGGGSNTGGSGSGSGSGTPSGEPATQVATDIDAAFVSRGVPDGKSIPSLISDALAAAQPAGVSLGQVDTEINSKVPALISTAIAAQGSGQGITPTQSIVNSLIFGG